LLLEQLERRELLASDWQNPLWAVDVDDVGFVAPGDALRVINDLNKNSSRQLTSPFDDVAYLDSDGDGYVAPNDVLVIINGINTALPSVPVAMQLGTDTGDSATDRITNDGSLAAGQTLKPHRL
jgi:hypothetical protein